MTTIDTIPVRVTPEPEAPAPAPPFPGFDLSALFAAFCGALKPHGGIPLVGLSALCGEPGQPPVVGPPLLKCDLMWTVPTPGMPSPAWRYHRGFQEQYPGQLAADFGGREQEAGKAFAVEALAGLKDCRRKAHGVILLPPN